MVRLPHSGSREVTELMSMATYERSAARQDILMSLPKQTKRSPNLLYKNTKADKRVKIDVNTADEPESLLTPCPKTHKNHGDTLEKMSLLAKAQNLRETLGEDLK